MLGKSIETKQLHTMLPSTCKHKYSPSPCTQGHPEPDVVFVFLVPVSSYLQIWITFSQALVKFYHYPEQYSVVSRSVDRCCMKTFNLLIFFNLLAYFDAAWSLPISLVYSFCKPLVFPTVTSFQSEESQPNFSFYSSCSVS